MRWLLAILLLVPRPARACTTWDVEYALNATLRITDTTLGAGDGTHAIGPGRLVLQLGPDGAVRVAEYELRDQFTITAKYLFASATVTTDTVTRALGAEGRLDGSVLRWSGPWRGMRSDGVLRCAGNLCGRFGAPPPGESPVHIAPHDARFAEFRFADDLRTFRMDWSVENHQESPTETSLVALAGREVRRTCRVE